MSLFKRKQSKEKDTPVAATNETPSNSPPVT
jgi:hypothetical protein